MYDFNCWVCFELFTEPVTLFCQHSFCKSCLEKSYKLEPLCPFCKKEFQLPLPPIDKKLNKRILKLKGFDVVDSDTEDSSSNNNSSNNSNNNNNNNDIVMKDFEQQSPQISIKKITFDILSLPATIYAQIFSYFKVKEILEFSLVSKEFHKIINHSWIWKAKLLQDAQFFTSLDKYNYDYKKCYQTHYKYEKNSNVGASGTFKMIPFRGHTQPITTLDHVGNIMVTGSVDNTVRVWDLASKKKGVNIHTFTAHTDRITCLKQGQYTVTSGSADSTVRICDLETGTETNCFTHKSGEIKSVNYNSNIEGQLITCGEQLLVWDTRRNSKDADRMLGIYGQVVSAQFHSNGLFFTNTSDYLDAWDMRKQDKPVFRLQGVEWFQPTKDYVFAKTTNNTLAKYDIRDGKLLHSKAMQTGIQPIHIAPAPIPHPIHLPHPPIHITPIIHPPIYLPNPINQPHPPIHIAPQPIHTPVPHPPINNIAIVDTPLIITATNDTVAYADLNNVTVLDSNLNHYSTLSNHTNRVNSILIDDKKIITGSMDNTIKVWDKKSSTRLYSLLGGSNTVNSSDPVPLVSGCSNIHYDRTRIIGVFNHLVRLYSFNLD